MPGKPIKQSASRKQRRDKTKKRKTLTPSKQSPTVKHSQLEQRSGMIPTPARFNASTRKLLSRHARDLRVCIMNGQHFEEGDYARIVRDLEALQAAIAKVVTDLAIVAEEE